MAFCIFLNIYIHSFNKRNVSLKNYPHVYDKIKDRKNVILLWDSLWDPQMAKCTSYENIINIWFLNDKVDKLLEEYKKHYCLTLTWDSEWEILNKLLK